MANHGAIVCDTNVLLGSISARDQHHMRAAATLASLRRRHAKLIVPRMVWLETAIHLERPWLRKPGAAPVDLIAVLNQIKIGFEVEEHEESDFERALQLRRNAPAHLRIELPDLVIVATADRLGATGIVTFDSAMSDWLSYWEHGLLVRAVPGPPTE